MSQQYMIDTAHLLQGQIAYTCARINQNIPINQK